MELQELAAELGTRALLLPTRDHDVNFIARHRDELDKAYLIAQPSGEDLDRVMNKDQLASIALQLGLAVPASVTVRMPEEIGRARSLRFPCICKPLYASQWRKAGIWEAVGRQKALKLQSYSELEAFYVRFAHLDPVVAIQEWIEGGEQDLKIFGAVCDERHEVVASFTARKRLQYPPLAGTGIVVEALPLLDLEEPSRALLSALRFRGICEIEFKHSSTDGRLYLIEVNPRHWDQHGLGVAAGVNLTEALYRVVTGQPVRPMRQGAGSVIWIAEADLVRHLARCAIGRARWNAALPGLRGRRAWAIYDPSDLRPFLASVGVRRRRR